MRQLLMIGSLVAGMLYAGAVAQYGTPAHSAMAPPPGLTALLEAMNGAGARPDRVIVFGFTDLPATAEFGRIKADLGWAEPVPAETRSLTTEPRGGMQHLSLRWVMAPTENWQGRAALISRVLAHSGSRALVTVQLEGSSTQADTTRLVGAALDAVGAEDRQPWADQRSASVAGRTHRLPQGPYPTNVQAAARLTAGKGATRVWVAWPALVQEY